ncbi:hypothetical protein VNO78_08430 [Psophocarpus tetragonolobus]|uniref:Uncharacterized protein n=1 Tax=Psophocarpus tetragonolobus TaxID=3891 RepID=A0AAN9T5R2_PSOTE
MSVCIFRFSFQLPLALQSHFFRIYFPYRLIFSFFSSHIISLPVPNLFSFGYLYLTATKQNMCVSVMGILAAFHRSILDCSGCHDLVPMNEKFYALQNMAP